MFSLLCGELYFLLRIINFLVSTFWRPELFVPRLLAPVRSGAEPFSREEQEFAFVVRDTGSFFLQALLYEVLL